MIHRIAIAAIAGVTIALLFGTDPASAIRGDPNDWTLLNGQSASRWDPCTAITWSTTDEGLAGELARAFRQVHRISGYTFERVPTDGAIVAEYVSRVRVEAETPSREGMAYVSSEPALDGSVWISGVEMMFWAGETDIRGAVLHQVGHAMGLGDVRHGTAGHLQVMGVDSRMTLFAGSAWRRYGSGDRAGLLALRPATCAPAERRSDVLPTVTLVH